MKSTGTDYRYLSGKLLFAPKRTLRQHPLQVAMWTKCMVLGRHVRHLAWLTSAELRRKQVQLDHFMVFGFVLVKVPLEFACFWHRSRMMGMVEPGIPVVVVGMAFKNICPG